MLVMDSSWEKCPVFNNLQGLDISLTVHHELTIY